MAPAKKLGAVASPRLEINFFSAQIYSGRSFQALFSNNLTPSDRQH